MISGKYLPPTSIPSIPIRISVSPRSLTKEDLEGRPIVDSADLVGNGKRILAMPLITSTSQITK